MDEGVSPDVGVRPESQPIAMTSSGHRHSRTRSQITALGIDLAHALSVAPAPHSWKDAEERVLSEFGGDFSAPTSPDANNPSPQKGYFVGDLEVMGSTQRIPPTPVPDALSSLVRATLSTLIASNDSLSSTFSNSSLDEDQRPPSMSSQRSPSPEVFGTVPVHCVRVIDPGSRRNSGESFYAYFIEDGDVVFDPPEEILRPRTTIVDRGRFREVVESQNLDDTYRVTGAGETSSTSDQEGAPPPTMGNRPSEDKRRNRFSQVIVGASKRSKRRMTSCTIQ